MEVFPFGLNMEGRREEIDILREGVKLPHLKK